MNELAIKEITEAMNLAKSMSEKFEEQYGQLDKQMKEVMSHYQRAVAEYNLSAKLLEKISSHSEQEVNDVPEVESSPTINVTDYIDSDGMIVEVKDEN